jgi:hypothetical protein
VVGYLALQEETLRKNHEGQEPAMKGKSHES